MALTTDEASNMRLAASSAGIPRVACAAHILHNTVNEALKLHKALHDVVTKCRDLALFFHKSPKMTQVLEEEQMREGTPSIQKVRVDVVTRWNSVLAMLRRLLELKDAMAAVHRGLGATDDADHLHAMNELTLTDDEWDNVRLIVGVLTLFEEATLIFSSASHGLATSMLPWMTSVFNELGKQSGNSTVDCLRQSLRQELEKRFKDSEAMMKASFFHPCFNITYSRMDPANFVRYKEKLRRELDGLRPRNNAPAQQPQDQQRQTGNLTAALLELVAMQDGNTNTNTNVPREDEFERYFRNRQCDDYLVNPVQWWKEHQTTFPSLALLARKYLSIQAASVASERLFSKAGNFATENRNRLTDDGLSDLVVCNSGRRCLQEARSYNEK